MAYVAIIATIMQNGESLRPDENFGPVALLLFYPPPLPHPDPGPADLRVFEGQAKPKAQITFTRLAFYNDLIAFSILVGLR